VNVALVNYYFGDKLKLYVEVIRYATDAAAKMEVLNRALERHADPCDALRALADLLRRTSDQLVHSRKQKF